MNESETSGALGDLRARVNELEKLPSRVSAIEKALWGAGGVIATIGFLFGIAADWVKTKLGGL